MRRVWLVRATIVGLLLAIAPLQAFGVLLGGVPLAAGQTAIVIHKIDDAHFTQHPDQPVFLLAVGNDARGGEGASRGDALHLIGINPAQGKATMLDIPRDTYVAIPGHGRDKINTAHVYGGLAMQAQVVGDLVGVHVSYVVDTNFPGFIDMVDELGGVDVDVPYPMNDSFSGAVFQPGRVHMDGHQALAFSRDRHLGNGDITRSFDQGLMILAALTKLRADPSSPAVLRE